MPCFGKKDGVCKSSANCVGSAQSGSRGTNVSQRSNGITCTDYVVVSAKQVADSIKVNVVSAHAFVNLVCGDADAVTWCTLVRPVVN